MIREIRDLFFPREAVVAAVLLAVILAGAGQSYAKDEDVGTWNANDVEKAFNKDWKIKAGEETKFREGLGLCYFDEHVGVQYRLKQFLFLGAEYLQVREKKTVGEKEEWLRESRPRIYATLQHSVLGFLFENRNLVEFRIKEDAVDSLRYRELVGVTAPYQWTRFKIQPYATNEIFFETHRAGLVQDRLICGFKMQIYKELSGAIYCMRQFEKSKNHWNEYNIIGTGLKYTF
jgi:hypothetical protein